MKALLLFTVVALAAIAGAPTVDAQPCGGRPVLEFVDCGIGGDRVYVCGQYVTEYCIWGP